MEKYNQLLSLIETFKIDFEKFYSKGNSAAGVRLRKNMQELRKFAQDVRDEVQARKMTEA